MTMTLKRKRPDGSPMFAPASSRPHPRPRALRGRSDRAGRRRDAGPGRGRRRPRPDRLRAAALGDRDGGGHSARARPVWDECPDNISNIFEAGRPRRHRGGVRAGPSGRAPPLRHHARVHAQFMEPRGALGVYDPHEDRYTLYADVQYPHRVRNALASSIFKIPEHQIRVDRRRRRRRLRDQGLAVSRAQARAVGGAQARPARSSGRASGARRSWPTSTRATT